MNKIEKIRDLHKFFIKKVKPKRPIFLRICKLKNYHGIYFYNKKRDLIILNKTDNLSCLYDGWTHEASHALQKNKRKSKCNIKDHTDEWGRCFARTYRIYLEWLEL